MGVGWADDSVEILPARVVDAQAYRDRDSVTFAACPSGGGTK